MGPHRDYQSRVHHDKGSIDNKEADRKQKLPPPPPLPPIPPRCPLTVQKVALIAALLYDWLRIESVIVNRSKSVQVILGGDFGKFAFPPGLFNEQALAEDIGLFEALEESGVYTNPGEVAASLPEEEAEEAAAIVSDTERRGPPRRTKRQQGRKLSKTFPAERRQSRRRRT